MLTSNTIVQASEAERDEFWNALKRFDVYSQYDQYNFNVAEVKLNPRLNFNFNNNPELFDIYLFKHQKGMQHALLERNTF